MKDGWHPFQFQLCRANNPKFSLCGSSRMHLLIQSIITLISPFKDIPCIILRPLNYVYKVTLSADPNDYMVVAIYHCGNLAYVGSGQTNSIYIGTSKSFFIDVIFYKRFIILLSISETSSYSSILVIRMILQVKQR